MSQDGKWPFDSESMREVQRLFKEAKEANQKDADAFWDNLSYDDKCNAFHAVVERIVKGDIIDKGSYRWVLYDVFGFGPEMYTRGMECGYMDLHNSIVDEDDEPNKWLIKQEAE